MSAAFEQHLDKRGVRPFNPDELKGFGAGYQDDIKRGLERAKSSLPMYKTLLTKVDPDYLVGTRVLVIEAGGTNNRTAGFEIDSLGSMIDVSPEYKLGNRRFDSVDQYFRGLLREDDHHLGLEPDAVGFIYSFPGKPVERGGSVDVISPNELPKGFFIPWNGQPVGEALTTHLSQRFGLPKLPYVVLNDTPAVLLDGGSDARIGVVAGTGFNLAVSLGGKIYNTESGGFASNPEALSFDTLPRNAYERKIDTRFRKSTGTQLTEKSISGLWLGRTFDLVANSLKNEGLLGEMRFSQKLTSESLSAVLGDSKDTLTNYGVDGIYSDRDLVVLRTVAGRLRDRSAQLVGAMVGAIVQEFPEEFVGQKVIKVPTEGSLFWKTPGYRNEATRTAEEITSRTVEFQEAKGISGAATAALSLVA